MDISKFYELRTRLYNTAAAGCMTVSEDFRLKRAVEDFKPLAAANKAFEKLYLLCEKLFSEKPETVLPDCIALAEALAVTQGTFADNAETSPATGASVPAQKPASALSAVKELMRKSSDELWKLSADYKDTLRDPRIVTAFLNELENGKFNENFKVFCEIMCEICGKALVPALKATVKDSGRQLQYIARLSGSEENELFRALATDENSPEKVRLAAISALSCSPENGALLAELYNTGKAKIKAAALLAMAEMDAPEAEPIFEKLFEDYKKNKKTFWEAIVASSGKVCTEFLRKHLGELPDELKSPKDENLASDIVLLANKTELEDMYLTFSTKKHADSFASARCTEALVAGLEGTKCKAVQAMIDRLYAKAPKEFSKAKVYSDILNNPLSEPVVPNDRYDRQSILTRTKYIPLLGGYYLQHYNYELPPLRRLSDKLPEWLIRYIYDSADNAEKLFKSLEAPTRDKMLEKAKQHGFNDARSCDALVVAYNNISGMVGPLGYSLYDLLENCVPEDREPLKQAAMYLVRKSVPIVGDGNFDKMIKQFIPEITPKEHSKMLADFIVNNMIMNNKPVTQYILSAISDPLTTDEKAAALTNLRTRISEWHGKMNDNVVNFNLNVIDNYLKKN